MELLINAIVSILLYAVFGAIGISIAKGNKTLKILVTKNLIVLSIIYVLLIALLMRDDPENRHFVDQIFMSLGNYIATYLGAIIAVKIVTKPKKTFL